TLTNICQDALICSLLAGLKTLLPHSVSDRLAKLFFFFFFNATATTEIYTLSLHDALPIRVNPGVNRGYRPGQLRPDGTLATFTRSEEHTSELQSLAYLVCRLLLEKKKKKRLYELKHTISDTDISHSIYTYHQLLIQSSISL